MAAWATPSPARPARIDLRDTVVGEIHPVFRLHPANRA